MRILITGASGFVGRELTATLTHAGHIVRASSRTGNVIPGTESSPSAELGPDTDWRPTLKDVDVVVHLAARVHQMEESVANALEAYRAVNTLGTLQLATQAAAEGVRRFVFLSSAKVWGEDSGRTAFSEALPTAPQDPYAISKSEAEAGLQALCAQSAMQFVVLRPPLVFGPRVQANFLRLLRWVAKGYPLPFAAVENRRSVIGLSNLVDAMIRCIHAPAAANKIFGVADSFPLSTAEIIRLLSRHMRQRSRLVWMPPALLHLAANALGRSAEMERLLGDFVVDTKHIRETLEWHPPLSTDAELGRTVAWYKGQAHT